MKLLFIGDIVGKIGRMAVKALLPNLVARFRIDLVVANGENAAAGFGITEKTASEIFNAGVHIITTGNHVWDKKEAVAYIAKEHRIVRPLNYPPGVPGAGSILYTLPNNEKIAILNVAGRVFMNPLDCPFRTARSEVERMREFTNMIFIDMHAEATSEKMAFGYYMDGIVSAVAGTHTHVQTADERILPGGTAFITDVGMTGPQVSVIGIEKDQIVEKFLCQMPRKYDVADGKAILSAVLIEIEEKSGNALAIQRIQLTNP